MYGSLSFFFFKEWLGFDDDPKKRIRFTNKTKDCISHMYLKDW